MIFWKMKQPKKKKKVVSEVAPKRSEEKDDKSRPLPDVDVRKFLGYGG